MNLGGYSEDTKFLTSTGWKLYDEISSKDKLATINVSNHNLEFQHFTNRVKEHYNGELYEIDNVYSNCLITENGNIYTSQIKSRNRNGIIYKEELANWHFNTITNLINDKLSYYHILTSLNNVNKEFCITDDMLNIIGLFVSEGTLMFRNNKIKSVVISQTKNGKSEVFDVMDSIDPKYGFKRYDYKKETRWISYNNKLAKFLHKHCNHKSINKRLPKFTYKLSKRQCEVLLNSLYLGDGTIKKENNKIYGMVYYTINKKLAEDVHFLAVLSEKDSLLRGGEKGYKSVSNFNGKDLYMFQVYIKDSHSVPKTIIFKKYTNVGSSSCTKGIQKIKYDGNVVGFSVPNKILITQRNGKISMHGDVI